MAKLRYTRDQMERIILSQLDHIEFLSEQNILFRQQNDLLTRINISLKKKLDNKELKPYIIKRKKKKFPEQAPQPSLAIAADSNS